MPMTPQQLPTGTVTFLFTDIEGSTRLVERLADGFVDVLEAHHGIVRSAIESHRGIAVSTEGDSFFAVFTSAEDAVGAALEAQTNLAAHVWPEGGAPTVRMGIHVGVGVLGGDNYTGRDVHVGARIGAAGHGGQILLSGAAAAAARTNARSLGWYRLRGIDGEVEIFEMPVPGMARAHPPLRTADTPTNLPAQSSMFLGRGDEVDDVTQLVSSHRLVTLVGPGGTGKTRLGIQVASMSLERFPGGVFFVALDTVLEPDDIPGAVLLAMGREGHRGGMASVVDIVDGSRMLLVLDNVEHLIAAAPVLNDLLGGCPNLHVLATSQLALNLRSETVHVVAPLGLPHEATLEGIEASDAAQLFVSIVEQRSRGFEVRDEDAPTIAAIVGKLDGLPLAIELAAARVRLFGLEGLLAEFDDHLVDLGGGSTDASDRHRTLSSAISWSYGLLDASQQAVLRHASVFVGGFGIDAVDEVCPSLGRSEVIEAVEGLLDRNLLVAGVEAGRSRFRMLETIKAFAHGHLVDHAEDRAVHRAHAEHYLAMVTGFIGQLRGPKAYAILETLTTERANIDAAMTWSVDHDPDLGLGALRVLARWFEVAGSLDDGRRMAERLLATAGASDRSRIAGLLGGASITYWLLDYPQAEGWYREAFDVAEAIADNALMGEAQLGLGFSLVWQGRVEEAEACVERALGIIGDAGDPATVMAAHQIRAIGLWIRGDFVSSAEHFGALMDFAVAQGDANGMLSGELVHAGLLLRIGHVREAAPHVVSVLGRYAVLGDEAGAIEALDYACVALTELDAPVGMRLTGAVRKITARRGGTVALTTLGFIDVRERGRERLGAYEVDRLLAEGEALSVDDATTLVLDWARDHGVEPRPVDTEAVLAQLRASSAN